MILEFKEGEGNDNGVKTVEIAFESRNIGDSFIANIERRIKRLKDRYNTFYEGDNNYHTQCSGSSSCSNIGEIETLNEK
jgi:hypothetical protein